ncbi:MAG: DNA/RNA non-specific endonuclease [Pyrinomonadaceae bacterium]
MKKLYFVFGLIAVFTAWMSLGFTTSAQNDDEKKINTRLNSTTLVISQVGSGGGGTTGTYIFDYVEIKNISGSTQSLGGLSLYYGSATGNFASQTSNAFALPNVSLNPGQYYMVQLGSAGMAGAAFPVTPDVTTLNLSMSGTSGKIALVNTTGIAQNVCGATASPCNSTQLAQFVDWVAYGTGGNGPAGSGEGGTSVNNGVGIATTQGSVRKGLGCTDTDNNNLDFDVVTNPIPRNTSTAVNVCAGAPTPTPTPTPSGTPTPTPTPSPSPTPTPGVGSIVISQFQTGGATAEDEFIELHNVGTDPVDLNGYRLVYRSASGSTDVGPFATWSTQTLVQPGQYYLIAATSYDGSAAANITYNPATCSCSMGVAGGGLALRPSVAGTPVDMVGWGTATNAFIEGAVTAAAPINDSRSRQNSGCQDTNNNANDFVATSPSTPRNQSSTPFLCGGNNGANLFASMNANPTAVAPGASILFTVTVTPATDPPSTGLAVDGNLSTVGGLASQPFYDNGTNGDMTAGDNIFSFSATVPGGTAGGNYVITSVAHDAQNRTVNLSQTIIVNAPFAGDNPITFGNPSNATPETANENNYLMHKPQYSLAYNRSKATANWVAWRIDSSWIGGANRQDDFRPDPALPAGWYQVADNDYSGSGFDRGHMCPSGDRTRSVPDNSATFLMTNMVPQLGANNQGPWNDFENYLRSLLSTNEVYIISGPQGVHATIPTISSGRITVPKWTWKVVLILPNGTDDLRRVNRATRAFGIIVSNESVTGGNGWRNYRVTVDAVETLTGYDFFSNVPRNTQEYIESRRDTQ